MIEYFSAGGSGTAIKCWWMMIVIIRVQLLSGISWFSLLNRLNRPFTIAHMTQVLSWDQEEENKRRFAEPSVLNLMTGITIHKYQRAMCNIMKFPHGVLLSRCTARALSLRLFTYTPINTEAIGVALLQSLFCRPHIFVWIHLIWSAASNSVSIFESQMGFFLQLIKFSRSELTESSKCGNCRQ